MSIPTEVKEPILMAFHHHIYDTDWHFPCELFTSCLLVFRLSLLSFSLILHAELHLYKLLSV